MYESCLMLVFSKLKPSGDDFVTVTESVDLFQDFLSPKENVLHLSDWKITRFRINPLLPPVNGTSITELLMADLTSKLLGDVKGRGQLNTTTKVNGSRLLFLTLWRSVE